MSASPAGHGARSSLLDPSRELPGRGLAWLEALRRDGVARFEELGLPTPRLEAWRFTDLRPLADADFYAPTAGPDVGAEVLHHSTELIPGAHRLVFAAGRLRPELSSPGELPRGVALRSLAELLSSEPDLLEGRLGATTELKTRALSALNTASFTDGAFVELTSGATAERPIHLVFVELPGELPAAVHPRNLILAGEGSRAVVLEHYVGAAPGGGLTNSVTEVCLGRDAELDHVSLQEQPPGSFHLAELCARQERGSRLRSHSIALGSRLSRVEIRTRLEGEHAQVELLGAYFARERQHQDHHTTIDHATPHTTSRELYKGILDDRGRGVFHGRVHVRPDAQKIDAEQTSRSLLLSDGARVNTKPQLEIYADDVRCSHGATVGQLDPSQLFYLRTRGIPLEEARSMLTAAFAGEVTARLPIDAVRAHLDCLVLGWMQRGKH